MRALRGEVTARLVLRLREDEAGLRRPSCLARDAVLDRPGVGGSSGLDQDDHVPALRCADLSSVHSRRANGRGGSVDLRATDRSELPAWRTAVPVATTDLALVGGSGRLPCPASVQDRPRDLRGDVERVASRPGSVRAACNAVAHTPDVGRAAREDLDRDRTPCRGRDQPGMNRGATDPAVIRVDARSVDRAERAPSRALIHHLKPVLTTVARGVCIPVDTTDRIGGRTC